MTARKSQKQLLIEHLEARLAETTRRGTPYFVENHPHRYGYEAALRELRNRGSGPLPRHLKAMAEKLVPQAGGQT